MKSFLCLLFIIFSAVACELYKGIKSECTKKLDRENIDGTFACLRESNDIYVPYFGIRDYILAVTNNKCDEAKKLFEKYRTDKKFNDCHWWWHVELK